MAANSRIAIGAFLAALCLVGSWDRPAAAGPVYNGGPVISGTPDLYYIWYGNWANNTAKSIITKFTGALNGTSYLNTDSGMSGNGHVALIKSTSISLTAHRKLYLGTSLNGEDGTIQNIVTGTLGKGLLPHDASGIYFVLTAPDIAVSGFNTTFCGWHDSTNWGSANLGTQFGFIGDPTASETGCYVQSTSPNKNFGADAMVSVIAHELIEATTDPIGTAWWDSNPASNTYGYENADMCAWNFGTTYLTGNGASANIKLGTKNYLLQRQWVNTGAGAGGCALSYSGPPITGTISNTLVVTNPSESVRHASVSGAKPNAVPEPASLVILGAGLAGIAGSRARRSRTKTA